MNPNETLLVAETHLLAREYRSALQCLDGIASRTSDIASAIAIETFRGKLLFGWLGDGVAARDAFTEVVKLNVIEPARPEDVANCIENLMTLSLSFVEFFQWAIALRPLQCGNPILYDLVPKVRKRQEDGDGWCSTLIWLAEGSWSMDGGPTDARHYACAASRYMLICTHRKELRPSRQQWKQAVINFSVATFRQRNDAVRDMLRRGVAVRRIDEELRLIVEPQEQLCDEYLKAWPGDAEVEARRKMLIDDRRDFERYAEETKAELGLTTVAMSRGAQRGGAADRSLMNQNKCRQCGSKLEGSVTCQECGATQWATLGKLFLLSLGTLGFGIGYADDPIWKGLLIVVGVFFLLGGLSGVALAIQALPESFEGQIGDVQTLLEIARTRSGKDKIISYYENARIGMDVLGQMQFMSDFSKDPLIALAHGKGAGHAFARPSLLVDVMMTHPVPFENYAELVRECRKRGYKVKRFPTFHATMK